jgi:chromosome segregation ATPase
MAVFRSREADLLMQLEDKDSLARTIEVCVFSAGWSRRCLTCAKRKLTTLGILRQPQAENASHVRALSSLRQRHRSTTSRLYLATSQLDDTRRDLEEQASAHVNLVKAHDEAERSLSSMMETIESLQTELEDAKKDVEEGKKVRSKLDKVVSGLRERCDDKQKELDAWLREEKGKDGEVSWRGSRGGQIDRKNG